MVDAESALTWHSITKVPIREHGQVVGLVGIARDTTKRKQAEDDLRRAHDDLQNAVEDRTLWLRQEIRRRAMAGDRVRVARDTAEVAQPGQNHVPRQ